MPRQAFWLKKYFGGRSPVSKMSDKEQTPAALWYSGKLSVKDSVGPPIPALFHEPEEGPKIPTLVRRQETGDVLENHPAGPKLCNQSKGDEGQVAARVVQPEPFSCDREGLAGASEDRSEEHTSELQSLMRISYAV